MLLYFQAGTPVADMCKEIEQLFLNLLETLVPLYDTKLISPPESTCSNYSTSSERERDLEYRKNKKLKANNDSIVHHS